MWESGEVLEMKAIPLISFLQLEAARIVFSQS